MHINFHVVAYSSFYDSFIRSKIAYEYTSQFRSKCARTSDSLNVHACVRVPIPRYGRCKYCVRYILCAFRSIVLAETLKCLKGNKTLAVTYTQY